MAVIVAISVAILMAFFFSVIWPMMRNNFQQTANCKKAVCDCSRARENNYQCTCWANAKDKEEGKGGFTCKWEG